MYIKGHINSTQGVCDVLVSAMSFTQIYPTILTLQSSYSSHILILINSPERSICNIQVFTCGCFPEGVNKVVCDQKSGD